MLVKGNAMLSNLDLVKQCDKYVSIMRSTLPLSSDQVLEMKLIFTNRQIPISA